MPKILQTSAAHQPASRLGHWRLSAFAFAAASSAFLLGCASTSHQAPVEERRPQVRTAQPPASSNTALGAPGSGSPTPNAGFNPLPGFTPQVSGSVVGADSSNTRPQLPGWENAGKPGYYTVKQGDTLIRIALDNGQNWRDVARWSALDNPNVIEVGQVLRVAPPQLGVASVPSVPGAVGGNVAAAGQAVTSPAATRPLQASGTVESRALDARAAANPGTATTAPTASGIVTAAPAPGTAGTAVPTTGSSNMAPPPAAGPSIAAAPAPTRQTSVTAVAVEGDEEVTWSWPASGPVRAGFDEVKSKGLAIVGKAGDPVLAAGDGRVVYAGSGLRGYGNLVIVKHNATYLTAYAHNQALLVKEDQPVRRGQKIAEMGSSDADRVQLHFEIRRLGKPVDPARLLPAR